MDAVRIYRSPWRPACEERAFVLHAVGVESQVLYDDQAWHLAVAAGDAEEIAEASSAMFGGRIAAFALAKLLGRTGKDRVRALTIAAEARDAFLKQKHLADLLAEVENWLKQ